MIRAHVKNLGSRTKHGCVGLFGSLPSTFSFVPPLSSCYSPAFPSSSPLPQRAGKVLTHTHSPRITLTRLCMLPCHSQGQNPQRETKCPGAPKYRECYVHTPSCRDLCISIFFFPDLLLLPSTSFSSSFSSPDSAWGHFWETAPSSPVALRGKVGGKLRNVPSHCYKTNACAPPTFLWWSLVPSVMVFGGGAFGKRLVRRAD